MPGILLRRALAGLALVALSASAESGPAFRKGAIGVGAAGMVPMGFDPKALYPARSHPRAMQLTVFGASDALGSGGAGAFERADQALRRPR